MQDELVQLERCIMWYLTPLLEGANVIGTMWIYRNKANEKGNINRNKVRLVAQGYTHEEGVDYDETFAPITRFKAMRFIMVMSCHLGFQLFQMDVQSIFLNGDLQDKVYVR